MLCRSRQYQSIPRKNPRRSIEGQNLRALVRQNEAVLATPPYLPYAAICGTIRQHPTPPKRYLHGGEGCSSTSSAKLMFAHLDRAAGKPSLVRPAKAMPPSFPKTYIKVNVPTPSNDSRSLCRRGACPDETF